MHLLASRGKGLASPAAAQLALLLMLADDPDVKLAVSGTETVHGISEAALAGYLAHGDVPEARRAHFATPEVHPVDAASADDGPLIDLDTPLPDGPVVELETADASRELSQLSLIDRINLAMKGTPE